MDAEYCQKHDLFGECPGCKYDLIAELKKELDLMRKQHTLATARAEHAESRTPEFVRQGRCQSIRQGSKEHTRCIRVADHKTEYHHGWTYYGDYITWS